MPTDQIYKLAHELSDALLKTAPKALEIALGVKRIDCVGNLIQNGVWFLASIVVIALAVRHFPRLLKGLNSADYADETSFGVAIVCVSLATIVAVVIGTATAVNLTDVWLWAGVFRPDLALAHDAIVKVLGK